MKTLAIILTLCTILSAQQAPSEWWADASQAQRDTVKAVYDRNKPYNKGWTMAAFTPDESSGGLFLFRSAENEAGYYAQKGYNVAKRERKQGRLQVPFDSLWVYTYKDADNPPKWEQDRAVQRLIQDRHFDDLHARAHIDELLRQYGGDWDEVFANWNSKKKGQADRVRAWIRFLRSLGWE